MSKIDELINKLCPESVVFLPLELLIKKNPKSKIGAKTAEKMEVGAIPFFTSGQNIYYVNEASVSGENIFANDGGYADFRYYKGDANYADHVISFKPNGINGRFLYHYLNMKKQYIDEVMFRGSGLRNINRKAFMNTPIPVPPLEVQSKIACILDNFTDLTAELTTELACRKKQYECYRDQLLSFGSKYQEISILDMLCQPITDGPHETPTLVVDGIPFLSAEAIIDNRLNFDHIRGFITKEYDAVCAKKYKPQKWDVYMCKSGSTTGKVAINDTDIDFNIWSPLAAMRVNEQHSAKYLFYLLQSKAVQEQVRMHASHGSQPNLSMRKLEQFKVKVPSLEVQKRIVNVLDNFEAICSDLNIGLPAEIEARQKQYEYYRDKLLTFDELKAA